MRIELPKDKLLEVIEYFEHVARTTTLRRNQRDEEWINRFRDIAIAMQEHVVDGSLQKNWLQRDISSHWRVIQDTAMNSDLYIAFDMVMTSCICAVDPSSFQNRSSHTRRWLRETFELPHEYPWHDSGQEPGTYASWSNTGISGVYKRGEPNPMIAWRNDNE